MKKNQHVEKGKLSDAAKAKIRQLARNDNTDTDRIMKLMPDIPQKLRSSVTAHLAIARRQEKQ